MHLNIQRLGQHVMHNHAKLYWCCSRISRNQSCTLRMQITASSGKSEEKSTTKRKPKKGKDAPSAATNGRRRRKQPEEEASVPLGQEGKQSFEGQKATEQEAAQAGDGSEEVAAPAPVAEESSQTSEGQETNGQEESNGIPVMVDYLTESRPSLKQPLQCHALQFPMLMAADKVLKWSLRVHLTSSLKCTRLMCEAACR